VRPQYGRWPIDAALIYAHRGWAVLPCHCPVGTSGRCSCGSAACASPGKHPRVATGLKAATTDDPQIHEWWQRWPRANVAIRTGALSDLVVVDIDPDHGGEASLQRLVSEQGALPEGRTVRTGSGGRHLYFHHPGDIVRNDAGRRLGPGLDVRGDGGYIIAPPSRHARGGSYRVEQHGGVVPEVPDWMLSLLNPPAPTRPSFPAAKIGNRTAWAQAALNGELDRLQGAREGTRNSTLNRVAYRLGQLVASGSLAEPEVEGLLIKGAFALGIDEAEAARTVRSGLQAGEVRGHPTGLEADHG
jgi:hypothetical protein